MWVDQKYQDGFRFSRGESNTATLSLIVGDVPSDPVGMLAGAQLALEYAPSAFMAPLVVGGDLVEELHYDPETGLGIFQYDIKYGEVERKEPGEEEYSFTTTGGSSKITQSLATVARYGAPAAEDGSGPTLPAPNFRGAINVTDNGVEGVEIPSPKLELTVKKWWESTQVSTAYLRVLSYATGCVNSDVWRGFLPGEVLFLGAEGSQQGQKPFQVQYKFAISQNATGLSVGHITGISKRGWDYLWVLYRSRKDVNPEGTETHALVRVPKAAYVEQVHDYVNFADLGIAV